MARRRCKATTQAGVECRAAPLRDSDFCIAHDEEARGRTGFGGPQPGSGRPPKAKPSEVLREQIEAEVARFLRPIFDALEAEAAVVVGHGASARVEMVPDHRVRLQAVRDALDRVYGKPKQTQQIQGGDTPVGIAVPRSADRAIAVAEALHEIGVLPSAGRQRLLTAPPERLRNGQE
jgi:hypothetical protein